MYSLRVISEDLFNSLAKKGLIPGNKIGEGKGESQEEIEREQLSPVNPHFGFLEQSWKNFSFKISKESKQSTKSSHTNG